LVRPSPNKPNEGVVEVSVDSSLAGGLDIVKNSNAGAQKRQLRERESTITSLLQRLVVPHAVNYKALVISPGKYVWRLCVDIVVLRCDGCVLDACAMAMREGLRSTLLPRVSAVVRSDDKDGFASQGGGSSNNDLIVEGDIRKALPPSGAEECPLVVTLSILSAPQEERIRHFCIVDARTEEEVCASSRVCVSVDPNGMVCGVHTLGGGGIVDEAMNEEFGVEGFGISSSMPMNMLSEVVNTAGGAAKNLYQLLDSEKFAGDSKAEDDGSGYGYLLQNQLIIQ
jgi:exosome complex RNA-binding protein Rrp42 (RNase PH superfamily)